MKYKVQEEIMAKKSSKLRAKINPERRARNDAFVKAALAEIPTPKKGTLEYLFKDYSGESFKTPLVNPATPVGNEKW